MKNLLPVRLTTVLILLATVSAIPANRCLAQGCGTIVACPGSVVVASGGCCQTTPCCSGVIVAGQCSTVVVLPAQPCAAAATAQNQTKTTTPTKSPTAVAVQIRQDADRDWTDATLTGLGEQISVTQGQDKYTLKTANLVSMIIEAVDKDGKVTQATFTYQTSDCKLHTLAKATITSGLSLGLGISQDKDGQLQLQVDLNNYKWIHFNHCCTPCPPPCTPCPPPCCTPCPPPSKPCPPPCCIPCLPPPCQKKMVS